jgi:hypothetical protein
LKHNYQDFETSIPWFTMDPCCFKASIPWSPDPRINHRVFAYLSTSIFVLLRIHVFIIAQPVIILRFRYFRVDEGRGKVFWHIGTRLAPHGKLLIRKLLSTTRNFPKFESDLQISERCGTGEKETLNKSLDVNQPTLIQSVPTKHK